MWYLIATEKLNEAWFLITSKKLKWHRALLLQMRTFLTGKIPMATSKSRPGTAILAFACFPFTKHGDLVFEWVEFWTNHTTNHSRSSRLRRVASYTCTPLRLQLAICSVLFVFMRWLADANRMASKYDTNKFERTAASTSSGYTTVLYFHLSLIAVTSIMIASHNSAKQTAR